MIFPDTKIENEILSEENVDVFIVGIDEVGRGPLAGPVVAAAAWVNPEFLDKKFELRNLIRDSKTLSEKQREEVFCFIEKSDDFQFGIGEVSPKMIDGMNILQASLLAMRIAAEELIKSNSTDYKSPTISYLLVDGNKEIPKIKGRQRIFVGGDKNVFSISAASIYAKVYRDRMMKKFHEQFPVYGFDRHKGYGTKFHLDQIKKHGPCEIHRWSFGPIKNC